MCGLEREGKKKGNLFSEDVLPLLEFIDRKGRAFDELINLGRYLAEQIPRSEREFGFSDDFVRLATTFSAAFRGKRGAE